MSERERLTELIRNTPKIPFTVCGRAQGKAYQTAKNIADHLLANGVIMPPCKVWDTVYHVYKGNTIVNALVVDWKKEASGDWLFRACFSMNGTSVTLLFGDNKIGKTVFLTREEAEKALAERSET